MSVIGMGEVTNAFVTDSVGDSVYILCGIWVCVAGAGEALGQNFWMARALALYIR